MLPKSWDTYELGDLAEFKSGGTPSKQNAEFWGGAFPWVSAKDMKFHYITSAELGLTDSGKQQANVAPIGAILVLVRGMTLLKDVPIGFVMRPVAFNQDIKALITGANVVPIFLSYFLVLQKRAMMALVNTANHGTGRLDTDLLRSLAVLLPPIAEQRRIAEILSTWDRAIAVQEQLVANARAQKKALMQTLLTGKKRLPGFKGEWKKLSLSEFAIIIMGSSPASAAYNAEGMGLPLIQGNADIVDRKTAPRMFTTDITQTCKVGDIIFSVRAPVGEISTAIHDACIGRGVAAIRPFSSKDRTFLHYLLLAAEEGWASLSQGSTFQAINSKELSNFEIYVPTLLEERETIAEAINTSDELEKSLDSQLNKRSQEKSALMQQLLTGKRRVKVEADT